MANVQTGYLKTKNGTQLFTTVPYPVGAIYLSVDSTDPSKLFGGTWEQIKGMYLLGVDESTSMSHNTANKAVGDWYAGYTNLSIEQMPMHSHIVDYHTHGQNTISADGNVNPFVIKNSDGILTVHIQLSNKKGLMVEKL